MPNVFLSPCFVATQQFTNAGAPLAGGKLNTYLAGTTTAASTYKDSAGTTLNANPIILNANGRLVDEVWLIQGQPYKFVLTDSSNNVLGTFDNISGVNDLYYPITPGEISASVTPVNYRYTPGNVLRYGSNTTPGTTDVRNFVQNSLNANGSCYFPAGTYKIGSTVNVGPGQAIYGDRPTAVTITSPATVNTFKWAGPGAGDAEGPFIHDLSITSDQPIVINNLSVLLADGAGDSPCRGAQLYNLILGPVTSGSGTGITASKLFDSEIRNNLILNYNNGIILNGCDINELSENRIALFTGYGILDQSGQSFGSQNSIHHNDMLNSQSSSAIYIKSTSIHVAIFDNYLEQINASNTNIFIDVTSTGAPSYGSNVVTSSHTIVIRDNRIDGEQLANYVFRIDPSGAVSIVCDNRFTTGFVGTSIFTPEVNGRYNGFHQRAIRIRGESWGEWHGYESGQANTAGSKGFSVNGMNLPALIDKDHTINLVVRGPKVVMPAGFPTSSLGWLVPGFTIDNALFFDSQAYTATVIARSTAASGDSLRIAMGSNTHGDILNTFALTNQFKRFSWTFNGHAKTGFDNMGAYVKRSGNSGDIEILLVSWEQQ